MNNILVFGTILYDVIMEKTLIGGCSTNVALHTAKLKCNTVLVSRVGVDDLGHSALRKFKQSGICTKYIGEDTEHQTGKVVVTLDESGSPSYIIAENTAYDYISLNENQMKQLAKMNFDMLYFGTIDQRSPTSANTLKNIINNINIKNKFYDINLRDNNYSKEIIDFSFENADICKLNLYEMKMLTKIFNLSINSEKEIVEWIFDTYSVYIIIITKGENGVTVHTRTIKKDFSGICVDVKDTVGSGDAFCAAFIAEYVKMNDSFSAAQKGNKLGAYVATKTGAVPEYESNFLHEML